MLTGGPSFIIRHVPDIDEARGFYTDKLGLVVEAQQEGFVQFASPGGATFALSRDQGAGEPIELWWFVENADATHDALRARGVEIAAPPKDEPFGRAFSIKDPSGNTVYLLQVRDG
jgi:predicted enzyme related to lactoylglutathione lyase